MLHKGVPGEVYNVGGYNEKTDINIVRLVIGYLHDYYNPELMNR